MKIKPNRITYSEEVREFDVTGDEGDDYVVRAVKTLERGLSKLMLSCNCKGWIRWRHCKHCDFIRDNGELP